MKKSKHLLMLVALFLFGLMLHAQTPGQNRGEMKDYYDHGDYVNASLKAIEFLRTNEKNKNAQEILSVSFNMALENLNTEIKDLKEKSKTFSGDKTVTDRKLIISKYELLKELDRKGREIVRIIPKQKVPLEFDKVNVSSELEAAQQSHTESVEMAADMHYKRGIDLMSKPERENQKSAAKEFQIAENYLAGYKDSKTLYDQARKKATTRVAILPFDNISGKNQYGGVGEMISDKLRATILNNRAANEFIEIYTRDQLSVILQEHNLNANSGIINQESIAKFGQALGIHLIITGKVMQLSAEQKQTINDEARISSKNVVIGQQNYVNSDGKQRTRNVYGDVAAKNFQHHKSAVASINGSYEMIEIESGRVSASSQFSEQYEWGNHWSTYIGDERAAVSPAGFDNSEIPAPSQTELANKVIDILGDKIAGNVINFIK
jgi:TolB-like protein